MGWKYKDHPVLGYNQDLAITDSGRGAETAAQILGQWAGPVTHETQLGAAFNDLLLQCTFFHITLYYYIDHKYVLLYIIIGNIMAFAKTPKRIRSGVF